MGAASSIVSPSGAPGALSRYQRATSSTSVSTPTIRTFWVTGSIFPSSASTSCPAPLGSGDVAGNPVRARDLGRLGARFRAEPRGPGDAEVVDDRVGREHRRQVSTQRVLRDEVAEPLDDGGREVAAHLVVEERVVRERGAADRVLEAALCVGEQDAELGPCHCPARPGTLGHLVRRREGLDLAFQLPVRLETLHEILVGLDALGRDRHLLREDLRLEVVVVEDV